MDFPSRYVGNDSDRNSNDNSHNSNKSNIILIFISVIVVVIVLLRVVKVVMKIFPMNNNSSSISNYNVPLTHSPIHDGIAHDFFGIIIINIIIIILLD
jgi:hypothetical protein